MEGYEETLTLIRELAIVRDENIVLRERLKLLNTERKYKKPIRSAIKLLSFMSKGRNVSIAKQSKAIVEEFEEIRLEIYKAKNVGV